MVGRVASRKKKNRYCDIALLCLYKPSLAYAVNGVEEYFVPTEVPCIIKHWKNNKRQFEINWNYTFFVSCFLQPAAS